MPTLTISKFIDNEIITTDETLMDQECMDNTNEECFDDEQNSYNVIDVLYYIPKVISLIIIDLKFLFNFSYILQYVFKI